MKDNFARQESNIDYSGGATGNARGTVPANGGAAPVQPLSNNTFSEAAAAGISPVKKLTLKERIANFWGSKAAAKPKTPDDEVAGLKKRERAAVNNLLSDIGNQLGTLDEQNKMMLYHLATVKENNESLLEQVDVMRRNNELLMEQFRESQKREKLSKVIAIVSSVLAIGFTVYRIIMVALGNGF